MNKETSLPIIGRYRYLLLTASILTFLLIVMGGIVRVTDSGLGCPDWPTCYGHLIPPPQLSSWIEWFHRLIAALTTPFILAGAAVGWWKYRAIRWVSRPVFIAVGFLVVEITLGAITVLTDVPPEIVAVHLGVALTILGLMITATVIAFSRRLYPAMPDRLSFNSRFSRLTLWTLATIFLVLVSGAFVVGSDSTAACTGWPFCNGMIFPATLAQWIQMVHRYIVALSAILVLVVAVRAWRGQRSPAAILPAATVFGVLYLAQVFVGALNTTRGFLPLLQSLHEATAAAVWSSAVVLCVVTGLAGRSDEEEKREAASGFNFLQHARDLFMMTRPIVVALLLVTAYGGMVVGMHQLPPFELAFWTLLGGALAAGGAQAVNMYVDRDIDRLMQRTANRPLPAGRLMPAEGLAWGLGLCIAAVYIVAGLVNWLAALLVLAGIIYYVVIYTLGLKRISVQNIVIGGGAGALPPLAGWAAATGSLNLEAVLLFVLVFLWTPPHFWALAIVRLKDYARAGVPMMPVVRGEAITRQRIMLYAAVLVVASMLLPLFGMTGIIYLVVAIVLGSWLLFAAWKVWRGNGNKVAWTLYRISSLYLAFLFVALIADALLKLPIIR
jgi:protoheme IX farnesyltransferase